MLNRLIRAAAIHMAATAVPKTEERGITAHDRHAGKRNPSPSDHWPIAPRPNGGLIRSDAFR